MTVTTGAEAVENALTAAFAWKARRRHGGRSWSADELAAVMLNRQPGIGGLKTISFEGGFHGRTLGALSATRSKAIHKLDFPAFVWPVVPFPANRFPLDAHADRPSRFAACTSSRGASTSKENVGRRVRAIGTPPRRASNCVGEEASLPIAERCPLDRRRSRIALVHWHGSAPERRSCSPRRPRR